MYDQPTEAGNRTGRIPRNKGEPIGQKPPLKLKEIWALRTRLQIDCRIRGLALFDLAIRHDYGTHSLRRTKVRVWIGATMAPCTKSSKQLALGRLADAHRAIR